MQKTIHEVISENTLKEVNYLPQSLCKNIKQITNEIQEILKEFKNKVQQIVLEHGLFSQFVLIQHKYVEEKENKYFKNDYSFKSKLLSLSIGFPQTRSVLKLNLVQGDINFTKRVLKNVEGQAESNIPKVYVPIDGAKTSQHNQFYSHAPSLKYL